MNIAVDTNCILPGKVGGIENYTLGLIKALQLPQSPADRIVLLTRPENQALFAPFADARTEVVALKRPVFRGRPVDNWSELLAARPEEGRRLLENFQRQKGDLLHRRRADVVHFPGNTINPLDLDLPVVLNLHDLQHRHFPQYFSREELANREQWWIRSGLRADALIAASDYVRDDLRRQIGADPAKIFVAPDVFRPAFLSAPTAAQLADVRRRFALPPTFFLYPAAAWRHKNHERLIRAFLAANVPGCQLILTGGGQEQSELPGTIASLGAQASVRLLGRVGTDDLVALYHLATVLAFPSEYESWSIPVMEAMACGCPVASSNVTSLPVQVGEAGLLFAPGDVNAMAEAMRRLAADPDLRRRLAECGRERVMEFTPERFIRGIAPAYEHARRARSLRKAG